MTILTESFAEANICVMELTLAAVALQAGRGRRFVQQSVRRGDLAALRLVGRQVVVDDLAATAWTRSLASGRKWSIGVRDAAFDLLSFGRTVRLSASERSRLRSRLREMDAQSIAHAAGGLGGAWGRYRAASSPELDLIGPSRVTDRVGGVVPGGSWVRFGRTADLDRFEHDFDVVLDAEGDLGVVERADADDREARVLLDCYLLGDARLSQASAARLEVRARGL